MQTKISYRAAPGGALIRRTHDASFFVTLELAFAVFVTVADGLQQLCAAPLAGWNEQR
jgi:hypothetical protein